MSFKIGDVVIGCNFIKKPDRNGMEGVIIEAGVIDTVHHITWEPSIADYGVEWSDGEIFYCKKRNLRKKQPPEQPAESDFQEWFKTIIKDPVTESTVRRTFIDSMWATK